MQSYQMSSPPPSPGIYALHNQKTGKLYIGRSINLRRRYQEWRATLSSGLGVKNYLMLEALDEICPEDWTFNVLLNLPNATDTDLARYEDRAIQKVHHLRPKAVLNATLPATRERKHHEVPKSVVLGEGGVPVSYKDAAAVLGTSTKQLMKRLKNRRKRGVFEVKLADLIADKEKFYYPKQ